MEIPKVSMIMPVYNSARVLDMALNSLLGQTLRDVEVIAVDDGSTDDAVKILNARAAADSRLRVIRQEKNGGTLSARNRGIRESRGEYLMFLDPDDFFELDAAEKLSILADSEHADIIHFGTKEFTRSKDGIKKLFNWTPPEEKRLSGSGTVIRDLLNRGHNWSLCFKMIRRDICIRALSDIKDFFCIMGEDFYFYLAAAFHSETYVQISKPYYNYDTTIGITGVQAMEPERFCRTASLLDALKEGEAFLRTKGLLDDPDLLACWEAIAKGQCRILWNLWYSRLAPGTRGQVGEHLLNRAWNKELFLLAVFDENDYLRENEEFLKFASSIYRVLNFFFPKNSYIRMCLKSWYRKMKHRKAVKK